MDHGVNSAHGRDIRHTSAGDRSPDLQVRLGAGEVLTNLQWLTGSKKREEEGVRMPTDQSVFTPLPIPEAVLEQKDSEAQFRR